MRPRRPSEAPSRRPRRRPRRRRRTRRAGGLRRLRPPRRPCPTPSSSSGLRSSDSSTRSRISLTLSSRALSSACASTPSIFSSTSPRWTCAPTLMLTSFRTLASTATCASRSSTSMSILSTLTTGMSTRTSGPSGMSLRIDHRVVRELLALALACFAIAATIGAALGSCPSARRSRSRFRPASTWGLAAPARMLPLERERDPDERLFDFDELPELPERLLLLDRELRWGIPCLPCRTVYRVTLLTCASSGPSRSPRQRRRSAGRSSRRAAPPR